MRRVAATGTIPREILARMWGPHSGSERLCVGACRTRPDPAPRGGTPFIASAEGCSLGGRSGAKARLARAGQLPPELVLGAAANVNVRFRPKADAGKPRSDHLHGEPICPQVELSSL